MGGDGWGIGRMLINYELNELYGFDGLNLATSLRILRIIGFKGFFYLLGLLLGFAAGVPNIHYLYNIPVNPIYKLVQPFHDNASILNWRIGKQRLFGAQIWIARKQSFCAIDFFEEFRAAF